MNYINFKALSKKLAGRSRPSICRDIKYKGFPPPISFGGSVAWDEDAVDRWLQQLADIPYVPKAVAVPKLGKRRGRKPKIKGGAADEK